MRATPTAVHFALASEAESIEAAHQASLVTHGDPAAGWGTALFHVMIRAALHGDDPFAALDSSLKALPPEQHRYVEMLDTGWRPSQAEFPNGTVWTCLAQAVWAVRTHRTSFPDAVTTAIDLGGDTDTVAAVTGGLAGALHGIQCIPSRWTTYLHGYWRHQRGDVRIARGICNDSRRVCWAKVQRPTPSSVHARDRKKSRLGSSLLTSARPVTWQRILR